MYSHKSILIQIFQSLLFLIIPTESLVIWKNTSMVKNIEHNKRHVSRFAENGIHAEIVPGHLQGCFWKKSSSLAVFCSGFFFPFRAFKETAAQAVFKLSLRAGKMA